MIIRREGFFLTVMINECKYKRRYNKARPLMPDDSNLARLVFEQL